MATAKLRRRLTAGQRNPAARGAQERLVAQDALDHLVDGEHVVIGVRDTGAGIGTEHRERIFTSGFTTKANQGGMGLGLASCRRVAEEHGGRLVVHHLEEGTRFDLVLPVDTGLAVVETRKDSRPVSEAPLTRSRLLIIDDDGALLLLDEGTVSRVISGSIILNGAAGTLT